MRRLSLRSSARESLSRRSSDMLMIWSRLLKSWTMPPANRPRESRWRDSLRLSVRSRSRRSASCSLPFRDSTSERRIWSSLARCWAGGAEASSRSGDSELGVMGGLGGALLTNHGGHTASPCLSGQIVSRLLASFAFEVPSRRRTKPPPLACRLARDLDRDRRRVARILPCIRLKRGGDVPVALSQSPSPRR